MTVIIITEGAHGKRFELTGAAAAIAAEIAKHADAVNGIREGAVECRIWPAVGERAGWVELLLTRLAAEFEWESTNG